MKYRKKPVVIEATQWFKNGDHPKDYAADHEGLENGELRTFSGAERKANGWEGDVVRYYRHPDVPGDKPCEQCGKPHHVHGWVDTLEQGHRVCPGDWIITGVAGEMYPCKPAIFDTTYEPADIRAERAEQRTPPGWISVSNRRPEPEVFVLCWDGKRTFVEWFGSKPDAGRGVTHWMPYPMPPGATSRMHDGRRAIAAAPPAPQAEQREPLTFNEFICLMDNSWMTSNDVQRDFDLAGMVERAHGIGAFKSR